MSHKLSHEETTELLRLLPSEEAESLLMKDNDRLVLYLAKKLMKRRGVDIEDIISVGRLGLLKAIRSFDISKNVKFSTYAGRCITNEILMAFRKEVKHINVVSIQEAIPNLKSDNLTFEDTLTDDKVNVEASVLDGIMISELMEGINLLQDKNILLVLIQKLLKYFTYLSLKLFLIQKRMRQLRIQGVISMKLLKREFLILF